MNAPGPDSRVVIAVGSGFLGRTLARHLAATGCRVTLLSRNRPVEEGPWSFLDWDARTLGDWANVFDRADALVNRAG